MARVIMGTVLMANVTEPKNVDIGYTRFPKDK